MIPSNLPPKLEPKDTSTLDRYSAIMDLTEQERRLLYRGLNNLKLFKRWAKTRANFVGQLLRTEIIYLQTVYATRPFYGAFSPTYQAMCIVIYASRLEGAAPYKSFHVIPPFDAIPSIKYNWLNNDDPDYLPKFIIPKLSQTFADYETLSCMKENYIRIFYKCLVDPIVLRGLKANRPRVLNAFYDGGLLKTSIQHGTIVFHPTDSAREAMKIIEYENYLSKLPFLSADRWPT